MHHESKSFTGEKGKYKFSIDLENQLFSPVGLTSGNYIRLKTFLGFQLKNHKCEGNI